jgi:hypothetical protein
MPDPCKGEEIAVPIVTPQQESLSVATNETPFCHVETNCLDEIFTSSKCSIFGFNSDIPSPQKVTTTKNTITTVSPAAHPISAVDYFKIIDKLVQECTSTAFKYPTNAQIFTTQISEC